jgi:predicted MFS family arabinose efflux permease
MQTKTRTLAIHRPKQKQEDSMGALLSIIRNALLAIGSGGAVAGWFSDQEWATVVSAILIIGSAVWKWIERRKHAKE